MAMSQGKQLWQQTVGEVADAGQDTREAAANAAQNVSARDIGSAADGVSLLSLGVAGGGMALAPFTEGASLAVVGPALGTSSAADAVSTGAKTYDYATGGKTTRGEVAAQGAATVIAPLAGNKIANASIKASKKVAQEVSETAVRNEAQLGVSIGVSTGKGFLDMTVLSQNM